MEKIKEFIANRKKAVSVFFNIILIIFGVYVVAYEILGGFIAEQLDEFSFFSCFTIILFFFQRHFLIFLMSFLVHLSKDLIKKP